MDAADMGVVRFTICVYASATGKEMIVAKVSYRIALRSSI